MAWRITRDYAAFNSGAEALVARTRWPYVLLRPPAVSAPLLVLADQTRAPGLEQEFRSWTATEAATVIDPGAVRAKVRDADLARYAFPEREDLLRCKWFAHAAGTATAVYGAAVSGASAEYEWAWLFAAGVERVLVLVRRHHEARIVRRRWLFRKRIVTRHVINLVVVEVTPDAISQHAYPHPMALFDEVARHLGIDPPAGPFPPHLPGFDSEPYHVLPPRKR